MPIAQWYRFDQLSPLQLYRLLALRQQVFVLEQQCLYADIDGVDPECLHLLYTGEQEAVLGYLRVIPGDTVRIGRVVVAEQARGSGLAGRMMVSALDYIRQHCAQHEVALSAQAHLTAFYGRYGFVAVSGEYLEDGIPHVDMRLSQG
ncbi:GNAT family N-acetyltransferase [Pokkaliibacter plantistimulans]|uniref:GNAT family N-acetyltransferase n=1 Tax=Pokkaliibacter plantistimulans TaxID=1635171 RepID=UPI000D74BB48|nr:GNAT family N-acetyltransferase [Pokkaliibacter plantistimulans]